MIETMFRNYFPYRLLAIAACIFHFASAGAQQIVSARQLNPMPAPRHPYIVVAHRGDHEHAPENTLAAFANAIKAGVDYVEIDLRTTVDSQLVIMHDASVNRMTGDSGMIRDMTYDAIRALKVKDKTHPEWGEFDVPTFDEVLALCRGKIYIYLDFKSADPAAAYKEIVKYGMERQVIVYINEERQFYQWRAAAPAMPLMVSLPGTIRDTAALNAFLNKAHPEILDGNYSQYTEDMIKAANEQGYVVLPDIEGPNENPAFWDKALLKGFSGVQTDHPEELIDYLKGKHSR
jgi:glycerophosphoryl diester phosphodiesterase